MLQFIGQAPLSYTSAAVLFEEQQQQQQHQQQQQLLHHLMWYSWFRGMMGTAFHELSRPPDNCSFMAAAAPALQPSGA